MLKFLSKIAYFFGYTIYKNSGLCSEIVLGIAKKDIKKGDLVLIDDSRIVTEGYGEARYDI